MNTRWVKTIALGVGFAAMSSLLTTGISVAQEVTLRMHQFLPAQSHVPKEVLRVWADKVENESDGRIKIDIYGAMELGGKPPELVDQVIDGVVDLIWTLPGYTPGRFPRTEVFELPFMMTDTESASRAFWDMFESDMKDEEFKDMHIIAAWVHGPGAIHSSKPVMQVSDMRGLKVRGASRAINMLLEELGAVGVGMPVPAVPESLSKGVIEAATLPWEVVDSLKVPELVNNHTDFTGKALYTATFIIAMNKARYESLPDDLKKVIDDNSGMETSVFAGTTHASNGPPTRQAVIKADNNVVMLSAEESEKWHEAAQPVYARWAADMDSKGYNGSGLIGAAQALIEKYSKTK